MVKTKRIEIKKAPKHIPDEEYEDDEEEQEEEQESIPEEYKEEEEPKTILKKRKTIAPQKLEELEAEEPANVQLSKNEILDVIEGSLGRLQQIVQHLRSMN